MIDSARNASALDSRLIKHRPSYSDNYDDCQIKEILERDGCVFLDIDREIVETGSRRRVYKRIHYVASCGHETSIRWMKYTHGQGRVCPGCCRPRGNKHHAYNPNLTYEDRAKSRDLYENTLWRRRVYEKDSYTCQVCGDNRGGNLVAHHLDGYADNPNKRFDVSNGITLCDKCHKAFHGRYTYRHNTRKQFKEWIKQDNTEVSLGTTA